MCIEHAGGMFIVQCAHWAIPLSGFPVSRKGKSDASESLHLLRKRRRIATPVRALTRNDIFVSLLRISLLCPLAKEFSVVCLLLIWYNQCNTS